MCHYQHSYRLNLQYRQCETNRNLTNFVKIVIMLRLLSNLTKQSAVVNPNNISSNPVCVQCVRFRRKPRFLPVAKSKMFRIPEHTKQDPEEKAELLRLHNNYRTQMRAVRGFLIAEVTKSKELSSTGKVLLTAEEEEAEFQKLVAINQEWNGKVALERNARLLREAEDQRLLIAQRLEQKMQRDLDRVESIEERVRLEKERSKTFITEQNIDAAIEHALANPVDYNFAIDLQGQLYHGRTTTPDEKKPETK
jgi:small subunit ribosomal protein S26